MAQDPLFNAARAAGFAMAPLDEPSTDGKKAADRPHLDMRFARSVKREPVLSPEISNAWSAWLNGLTGWLPNRRKVV